MFILLVVELSFSDEFDVEFQTNLIRFFIEIDLED